MSAPAGERGSWAKVELVSSYSLLVLLGSVIATRLSFSTVWTLHTVDLVLTWMALAAVIASFWIARRSRRRRFLIIGFASATQLVPMVIREPVLLFPLLGAVIPVAILLIALRALARKAPPGQPPQHS